MRAEGIGVSVLRAGDAGWTGPLPEILAEERGQRIE